MKTLDAYDAMLDDITRACALQEVPTGVLTAEYAAGQFEINLEPVDDLVLAPDDCILFKRIVQGVAQRHGLPATFMALPSLDRAASGRPLSGSVHDAHGSAGFDAGARQTAA